MKAKPISPEQGAELEAATIRNIIEKVAAGGIPTARELDMLKEATAEPAPPEPAGGETFGPRLNIRQLARLTGKTRETIAQRLAAIPHGTAETGAKLYDSKAALEAIYTAASTTEAESRRQLNDARRELTTLQGECLRKARVPLTAATEINERALSNVAGILKSRIGKTFDEPTLQECFAELATIGKGIVALGPDAPLTTKKPRKKQKPRKR